MIYMYIMILIVPQYGIIISFLYTTAPFLSLQSQSYPYTDTSYLFFPILFFYFFLSPYFSSLLLTYNYNLQSYN